MRLLSCNCRGLRNPQTVRELLIKEKGPSIMFLSETRLDSKSVEFLRVKIKFKYAFCVPRIVFGGGLALFWNDDVDVRMATYSKNHIDSNVVMKESRKKFRIIGFYGNPETQKEGFLGVIKTSLSLESFTMDMLW